MSLTRGLGTALLLVMSLCGVAVAQTVNVGAGTYYLAPKGGDKPVPQAPMRTEAMARLAVPTNQWYSSLVFNPKPEVIYVQPLTVKATPAGLEVALPGKEVVPTERQDVEIHYPHRDPIVLAPAGFEPGPAKLAKASDWAIDIAMDQGADRMRVTVAHGSPYAAVQLSRGDLKLSLPAPGQRIDDADPRVLALRVKDRTYALFGPTGVRWEQQSPTQWLGRLPEGKGYVAAAALPDDKPETLALLTRHAYAFIDDTRVDWRYDERASRVETTFKATTRTMEGAEVGPLLGLYPHQWFDNPSVDGRLGPAYDTVRGKIRLLPASQFSTVRRYHGFVPWWPGIKESPRLDELDRVMSSDKRNARRMMLENGRGPYWQGKGLQRIAKLMDVAEQQGDAEGRDRLMQLLKSRFETWFRGEGRTYFHYDKSVGTVVAYPEEFFFVEQLNDHHFTYGYWIRAAAEIALRDPAWADKSQWGGMVDLLIADIATAERGRSDFPFLRNFDPYEGHSWASGIGLGEFGNNQESSSEAINAWVGLILWGEVTGDRALRDLGVFLYTSEIDAINHYWFDLHGLVFAPEYKNVEVSMLFGGKYSHNTWWTDEPRQIKGINLLPITTASSYLALDPKYIKRNLGVLDAEMALWSRGYRRANPPDIWQDIFAKYMALADPPAGLAMWNRWGAVEFGDTRSHTLHMLLSLQEMGAPDLDVSADTTLYAVFKRADGKRTYLAYNATAAPIDVRFSDGKTITVAPRTLGQTN